MTFYVYFLENIPNNSNDRQLVGTIEYPETDDPIKLLTVAKEKFKPDPEKHGILVTDTKYDPKKEKIRNFHPFTYNLFDVISFN